MAIGFAQLYKTHKKDVMNTYFELLIDAQQSQLLEYQSCVKIQRYWRGVLTRSRLQNLRNIVSKIQASIRVFLNRQSAERQFRAHVARIRKEYWDSNAIVIQRRWRGYYTRKNVFCFENRRAYIESIKSINEKVCLEIEMKQEVVEQKRLVEEQQKKEEQRRRALCNIHHLIGTKAIPGVLSLPEVKMKRPQTACSERTFRPASSFSRPQTARTISYGLNHRNHTVVIPKDVIRARITPAAHSRPHTAKTDKTITTNTLKPTENEIQKVVLEQIRSTKPKKLQPTESVLNIKRAQGPFLVFLID